MHHYCLTEASVIHCSMYISQSVSYRLSGGKRGDYRTCSILYCVLKLVHSRL